jgi:hypothetical protein
VKHLEAEQLKKYVERQLSSDEMTQAILHLDGCLKCFNNLQKMFPALSDQDREVSFDALTAEKEGTDIFHLDYEEHLRPFVDFETDAVTREIIESHLQNCPVCARELRELREFSDSLKLRTLKKENSSLTPTFDSTAGHRSLRLLGGHFLRLSLPAAAVLILGFGGWLVWRQSETPRVIVENQTPNNTPKISENKNISDPLPENTLPENSESSPAIKARNPPVPTRENDSDNKTSKKPSKTVSTESPVRELTENERILAALPPNLRPQFQKAVQTRTITLPAFIAELREDGSFRGKSSDGRNQILSPNAQAVRNLYPIFKWQKFADPGEHYVVTIYDRDFNQIFVSENLRTTEWKLTVPLERGKIYKWQVKAENSSQAYSAQFKVLDENAALRVQTIENAASFSPIARGIGYASEGLLGEAAEEFQKEIRRNPRGKLAKDLKDSLIQKSKRN